MNNLRSIRKDWDLIESLIKDNSRILDIGCGEGDLIQQLEKNYAVRDKQDVLAMCSLQYAAQLQKFNDQTNSSSIVSENKLEELIDMIDIHLAAY